MKIGLPMISKNVSSEVVITLGVAGSLRSPRYGTPSSPAAPSGSLSSGLSAVAFGGAGGSMIITGCTMVDGSAPSAVTVMTKLC